MTLKEELEILRGEPIRAFSGDPMDIPCIETSDPERLCKHPVVSVSMITYNHESFIRQAIEGVMMQKTDFEFELIIGEDCSKDKTREICFEYQKKYADKIRVLWWHENLRRVNHPAGCNSQRNYAHARGEFVALCEGDDYWTDPLKLQKQVDEVNRTGAVMCVADSEWRCPDGKIIYRHYDDYPKLMTVDEVYRYYHHTSTLLFRADMFEKCTRCVFKDMPGWSDVVLQVCMAKMGPVCYLPENVSVYNWTGNGMGGYEGSLRRFILMLTQQVELYLWGPSEIKPQVAGAILWIISDYFDTRGMLVLPHDGLSVKQMRAVRHIRRRVAYERGGFRRMMSEEKCALKKKFCSIYMKHPVLQRLWRGLKGAVGA